ncbi:MAG: hypothetical protein H6Q64_105 [Firmicutes bacterium]|nr:hypothetical protein [Bacillota bacterium]
MYPVKNSLTRASFQVIHIWKDAFCIMSVLDVHKELPYLKGGGTQ